MSAVQCALDTHWPQKMLQYEAAGQSAWAAHSAGWHDVRSTSHSNAYGQPKQSSSVKQVPASGHSAVVSSQYEPTGQSGSAAQLASSHVPRTVSHVSAPSGENTNAQSPSTSHSALGSHVPAPGGQC